MKKFADKMDVKGKDLFFNLVRMLFKPTFAVLYGCGLLGWKYSLTTAAWLSLGPVASGHNKVARHE